MLDKLVQHPLFQRQGQWVQHHAYLLYWQGGHSPRPPFPAEGGGGGVVHTIFSPALAKYLTGSRITLPKTSMRGRVKHNLLIRTNQENCVDPSQESGYLALTVKSFLYFSLQGVMFLIWFQNVCSAQWYVVLQWSSCFALSRRGLVQEDKRMVLVYTHGLFIT